MWKPTGNVSKLDETTFPRLLQVQRAPHSLRPKSCIWMVALHCNATNAMPPTLKLSKNYESSLHGQKIIIWWRAQTVNQTVNPLFMGAKNNLMVGRSNIHKPALLHFHIYCEKNHKIPSIFREEKYFNGGTLVVQAFGNCISSVRKWHSLWHGVAKWHSALQWHDSNTKKWLGHKYFDICLSKQTKNKKAQCNLFFFFFYFSWTNKNQKARHTV